MFMCANYCSDQLIPVCFNLRTIPCKPVYNHHRFVSNWELQGIWNPGIWQDPHNCHHPSERLDGYGFHSCYWWLYRWADQQLPITTSTSIHKRQVLDIMYITLKSCPIKSTIVSFEANYGHINLHKRKISSITQTVPIFHHMYVSH